MNERYWVEQIAKKDAEIQRLTNILIEKVEYEGRYYTLLDKVPKIEVDETFEDMLTEEELEKISKADKPKKKK